MARKRKSAMGRKLAALAAKPGVIDAVHINVWTTDDAGEPKSEIGRQVSIEYRRADGGKRLNAQKGKAW
jgi:hypothetical protein